MLCGSSQMPKQDYKKLLAQKNNKTQVIVLITVQMQIMFSKRLQKHKWYGYQKQEKSIIQ